MKLKLVLLLAFTSLLSFSQKIEEFIDSKKLNEKRTLSVLLPVSYEKNLGKKYPVLYLLDGEYLAEPFSGNLRYGSYWDDLPEMIIVAIHQNYGETRYNDCTYDDNGFPSKSGASFFEFIGTELIPIIEKKYRTIPFRMIAGHDTTAGFLNCYLYKDDPIFSAYISISPEMAPEMEDRLADRLTTLPKRIFYYHATSTGDLEDIQESTKKVDDAVKNNKKPNLYYQYDLLNNTSHYSLVAKAIPNALYFIFDGYQPISKAEFNDKILTLESGYTKYLIDKYTSIEQKFGIQVQPRLSDFKAIEAAILKNKAYAELEALSDYANKQYPKTMLGTYEKALFYEKTGDIAKAIKEYQKGYSQQEIGHLTKNYLLERADALKQSK